MYDINLSAAYVVQPRDSAFNLTECLRRCIISILWRTLLLAAATLAYLFITHEAAKTHTNNETNAHIK